MTKKMQMNIIGAGHVGQTLGHLLVKLRRVQIGAVCNRTIASALRAIEFIGEGRSSASIGALPHAALTLITTPDDQIVDACLALSLNAHIQPGDVVIHCSGSQSSDSLRSVQRQGCFVGSVHPMRSFTCSTLSVVEFPGTYCAMEGDLPALSLMEGLLQAIGSITYVIHKEKKSLYHAAGVFASNYVVTLSQQALQCLIEAGVEQTMAMQIITGLMQSTVSNLEQVSTPAQALTGPIQRGDVSCIQAHVLALKTPMQKKLYALLGQATLPLASLDQKQVAQIAITLENDDGYDI